MPEQIILEFVGDPSGLKPVADAMSALGKLTDDQRKSLQKATDDFNTRKTAIVASEKASADAIGKTTTAISNEAAELNKVSKGLNEISKSVAGGNLKGVSDTFKKAGDAIGETVTKTISLKTQLRTLKQELQGLEVGSKRFKEASIEAAKLEDKIGDVNEQIRVMSKDTFALDAVVDGVRGITAAYSLAQGAGALFGEENKNLQEALVKINALMLVSTSLQEVSNQLTGQGAAKLGILSIATKVQTFVMEGATFAAKAFRGALVGLGLGLVVTLLYEAAKAFGLFTDSVDDNTSALDKNEEARKTFLEQDEAIINKLEELKVSEKARLEAALKSAEQLRKIRADDVNGYDTLLKKAKESGDKNYIIEVENYIKKDALRIKEINDEVKVLDERISATKDALAAIAKEEDAARKKEAEARKKADKPTEMLAQIEEGYKQEQAALQRKIDAEIAAEKKALDDKKKLKEDAADAEKANEKELMDHIATLHKKKDDEIVKSEKDAAAKKEELRQAEIQAVGILVSTIFTITNAQRNADYEAQLNHLATMRDAELNNKDLTEAQKAAINEKYRREEAAIKRKQFEQERSAKIIEATIATALAVVKALPNYVAAALAGVAGAAQIAIIASQPTPAFAKGTEYVEGAGTGTSDSIHAKLSKGERVVPAKINESLAGIPNEALPRLAALAGMIPNISGDYLGGLDRNASASFDYKLMAKEISSTLANATKPQISIDKNGFNILLVKGNSRATYLNNRYLSK